MIESSSMNYSGAGRRFAAYLIDIVVQVVIVGLVAFSLEFQRVIGLLSSGFLLFLISWFYFAFLESSKYQATLGKLLLKIKVVDLYGNRISFFKASGRFFGKFLSKLFLGFGYLMMLFTKKKQCLHDKLASTLIVSQKSEVRMQK